jgi:hypothetical protein
MASRTQIVCLCEGAKGQSIDEVFINKLIKSLAPGWIRPWAGSNTLRLVPCGGRKALIQNMPAELQRCSKAGADTTLMVWGDCDDTCADGEALMAAFWKEAQRQGVTQEQFDRVVFIFAKDRLENWIEFLQAGNTDEAKEGPRVKHNRDVADAARKLAELCKTGKPVADMPPSLKWSCKNWRTLVGRMGDQRGRHF